MRKAAQLPAVPLAWAPVTASAPYPSRMDRVHHCELLRDCHERRRPPFRGSALQSAHQQERHRQALWLGLQADDLWGADTFPADAFAGPSLRREALDQTGVQDKVAAAGGQHEVLVAS